MCQRLGSATLTCNLASVIPLAHGVNNFTPNPTTGSLTSLFQEAKSQHTFMTQFDFCEYVLCKKKNHEWALSAPLAVTVPAKKVIGSFEPTSDLADQLDSGTNAMVRSSSIYSIYSYIAIYIAGWTNEWSCSPAGLGHQCNVMIRQEL